MSRTLSLFLLPMLLLGGCQSDGKFPGEVRTRDLEQKISSIDRELKTLAEFTMRGGMGAVGFRSADHDSARGTEWVRIDLAETLPFHEIILVPSIWRDATVGLKAESFPQKLEIYAGLPGDNEGQLIATHESSGKNLDAIAPRIIALPETKASWIKVQATELGRRSFDGLYCMELSEVIVLSGEKNVALHRPVSHSPVVAGSPQRKPGFLVDGHLPYLMDGPSDRSTIAFFTPVEPDILPTLEIDLGDIHSLDQVNLYAVERSDTIPAGLQEDLAIPNHLKIEGSLEPDFTDPQLLCEIQHRTAYDAGPIITCRFPPTRCRYVRFSFIEPAFYLDPTSGKNCVGFAEIELLENQKNIALGKTFQPNFPVISKARSVNTLTDGYNYYGKILPIAEWMHQLARRAELESERPALVASLNARYAKQKQILNLLAWLAALLAFGIVTLFLVDRIIRIRQISKIRERFAADLHDELGANVHSISLLGDLMTDSLHSPEDLAETIAEMKALTKRTEQAIRHCADVQQHGISGTLLNDMQRTAHSILHGLDYDLSVECENKLSKLGPKVRADLFLFFKESLVNVTRHADATQCSIKLFEENKAIILTIADNGCDSKEYRNVIDLALRRSEDLELVSTVGTAERGITTLENDKESLGIDILLLDLQLPGISGIEAISKFRQFAPNLKIIVLTHSNKEADVLSVLAKGADGYLLKSTSVREIRSGIRTVYEGGTLLDPHIAKYALQNLKTSADASSESILTEREIQILQLTGEGLVKKEIAQKLGVSFFTVAAHIRNIHEKLGALNAPSAVAKAYKKGIL
eukprot:g4179.t1